MNDVLHMLLGAALVCLGILATAAADRIRQLRITRRVNTRVLEEVSPRTTRTPVVVLSSGSDDVVTALVSAGYKKALASRAALACTAHEQTTAETWMAAALRRCVQGGAS
jgi:Holliday junction resolvasome RuvABC DNA-binding subunit